MLLAWRNAGESAPGRLKTGVYQEQHRIAHKYPCRKRIDHPLQTSALVNEAFLQPVDWKKVQWKNRAHFFAILAQLTRLILVDFVRSHRFAKRGVGLGR